MFEDEKQIIECARRWYAAAKKNRDPALTDKLASQLAAAVVVFERERKLKHMKPKPIACFVSGR
jgi:hypothetical protein